ncbi:MAG TPA: ester cyclase [Thermoplasmata archaeon]|nr:ester cyclase [Thermoplasmata archaeon]
MAGQTSLQVIEGAEKALRANDWTRFGELHAENVVLHAPDQPEPVMGRAAVIEWYRGFTTAFPDLNPARTSVVAQGDWIAAEYNVTGTHTGTLAGPGGLPIPPTNKAVAVANAAFYKIREGKIVEIHEYFDLAGFMSQLGLGP